MGCIMDMRSGAGSFALFERNVEKAASNGFLGCCVGVDCKKNVNGNFEIGRADNIRPYECI